MLINVLPEPANGPRPARDAASRSDATRADPAASFGAILARFDRFGSAPTAVPQDSAEATDAPPAEPEAAARPSDAAAETPPKMEKPGPEARVSATGSDADAPAARRTETDASTAVRAPLHADLPAERAADNAAPASPKAPPAPARVEAKALHPRFAEAEGRQVTADPASAAHGVPSATEISLARPGAEAQILHPPSATPNAPPSSATRTEAAKPSTATSAAEPRPTFPPMTPMPAASPLAEPARPAFSSEARFALLDRGGPRRFDPAATFGAGFGDVGATTASDAPGERFLRTATTAGAELVRDIAQQMGARITPLARGQFELMLSPAELGRLEISLREVDGVMTLSVMAERPETLDLIRRHIDLLAQDLRQLAQRDLTLQLGTGGPGGNAGGSAATPRAPSAAVPEVLTADPVIAPCAATTSDHLDLRL